MEALLPKTLSTVRDNEAAIVNSWIDSLAGPGSAWQENELRQHTQEFIRLLLQGASAAGAGSLSGEGWSDMRAYLERLSASRAVQGFTSQQTAGFVFSAKRPMFSLLQNEPDQLWALSELIDELGLYTVRVFQKTREEIIQRQQEELLELSTPVVKLWDGILALPMIGTLDSQRTQVVMETLLQRIVETGSELAIIDITGVPTVDTLVAQHLLKTVTAIRLMGADCIISGIRPQIAQTIVHLGLDLEGIDTKASLADALRLALKRSGLSISEA